MNSPAGENFILFAHRGASGYEPENTLLSFRRALAMGAKWLEVDVYAVEDDLVVIHDDSLSRTTDGEGFVMGHTLRYLRGLDAGKGERIPLLSEVFDLLGNEGGVNIELKGPATAGPVASLIEDYLQDAKLTPEQFIVSSFNHEELFSFRRLQPHIRIAPLVIAIPRGYALFASRMGAYAVHAARKAATKKFIADAHRRGLRFHVFTINSRKDTAIMIKRGVDGIFTDYPDLLSRFCP